MCLLKNWILVALMLGYNLLNAQNYHAINGSVYAGSLSPALNPASIVHVPYAWDITPFSVQLKQSTNAFKIENFSMLSKPDSIEVSSENGIKKRFLSANQDIHLLNTRISLNSKAAIAFGANIRSHMYAASSESNYQDTIFSLADYMKINTGHLPLSGELTGSVWAELYATYARTIVDDGDRLLNAGITLKVTRGLAGGYLRTSDIRYTPTLPATRPSYLLTNGILQYGYSSNFDNLDSNNDFSANSKIFLQKTYSSPAADIGVEYILLTDEDRGEDDYAYETKIGVSILDIGSNKYRHGRRSRLATAGRPGITDTLLEDKMTTVDSFDEFNDSLSTIANSFSSVGGDFFVYQPTRLMINLDQHIIHNFFVNAQLTIPFQSLLSKKTLSVKDINLLAVTPRWEVKSLGAYFPILFNTRQQLWVGGAFKAGPVLLGTHNLGGLFSKNKAQRGGLYLALTIRPGKKYSRQEHYPKDKLSAKDKRSLECPAF